MVWSIDVTLLTVMQAWRVIGFVFLPFYAVVLLPGLFAWPAGLGDVAIGLIAVVMVMRLNRNPEYIYNSGFVWFNVIGVLDFAVAVITAGLVAGGFPEMITNGITSAPLDVWPMNIFPSISCPYLLLCTYACC